MRQHLAVGTTAILITGLLVSSASAQDEDLRMGDDPAYFQRIEVPEAGVAVSFPETWDVETVMEYDLVDADDPDSGFWRVLFASGADDGWCSLYRYLDPFDSVGMFSAYLSDSWQEERGDGATVDWWVFDLPVGETYRIDVHEPSADDFSSLYLTDHAGARYHLRCGSEVRHEDDWMDVAETLEWLSVDGIIDPPGAEPLDEPQPEPMDEAEPVDAPTSDVRRIEAPEAGISLAIPDGWTYEAVMEASDYHLPSEFGEGSTVPRTWVASMDHGDRSLGSCGIGTFEEMPMGLERHAQEVGTRLSGSDPSALPVTTLVELPIGSAARVDFESVATAYPSTAWVFDVDGLRVVLDCWADRDDKPVWEAMVDSIEPLAMETADEPPSEPADTPGAEDRRIEVPEAGIALTIPGDWGYEIAMETGAYELPADFGEGSSVPQTHVLSATSPGIGMCILTTYEGMPMSTDQHALEHGLLNTSSIVDEDPIVSEVQRSAGPAVRVDFLAMLGWGRAWVFDLSGLRYVLDCFGADDDVDAFWPIADSIEALGVEPEPGEDTEPIKPVGGVQRIELDEAGIALTLPGDWEVLPETEYVGPDLLPDGPEIVEVDLWRVMRAYPTDGVWCSVFTYDGIQLSLDDHAATFKENVEIDIFGPPSRTAEVERVPLPIGDAVRLTVTHEDGGVVNTYLFDADGDRELLECGAPNEPEDAWLSVAESIESLGGEPPAAEVQRVEVDEAGMAISFPPDWDISVEMETEEMGLPPEVEGTYYVTTVLTASSDGAMCNIFHFADLPFTMVEHAAATTAEVLEDPDFKGLMEGGPMWLPAGEAIRSIVEHGHKGIWTTDYFLESGADRYLLACGGLDRADDDFLSIAETFEFLGEGSAPDVPEGASFWSEVAQFGTQFPVLDPSIEASLVSAWCDRALWFEFPDGTFEERDECRLTIDPVEPPEAQAAWPEETVTLGGGPCEWISDFWLVNDGSEVWASSWSITVEPDGTAVATSTYGAEEIDCSD